MEASSPHYSFAARLERGECDLLRKAQEKAKQRLGGTPSNALLLVEVLRAYVNAA